MGKSDIIKKSQQTERSIGMVINVKKYVFIIMLLFILVLCSCSNVNAAYNDKTDFQVTSSDIQATYSTTVKVNAVKPSEITESDLETSTALCFAEDEAIRAYANAITVNKTLYDGGGLYDLDFDGVPEYVWRNGGEGTTEFYYVYKYINDTPTEVGVMIQSYYDDLFTLPGITLYYDKESNNYFYVSESAATDKMALCKYAEVKRYTFSGDVMAEEILSRCDFNTHWDNELLDYETIDIKSNILLGENTSPVGITKIESMTSYYDGLSNYLDAFEEIGVFEFKCMTNGEYGNIYDNLYYNYYISDNHNMINK